MNDFYLFLLMLLFLIVSDRSLPVMIRDCQSRGPGSIPGGRNYLRSFDRGNSQYGIPSGRIFAQQKIDKQSPALLCRIGTFLSPGPGQSFQLELVPMDHKTLFCRSSNILPRFNSVPVQILRKSLKYQFPQFHELFAARVIHQLE
jgi:hypothetical protein